MAKEIIKNFILVVGCGTIGGLLSVLIIKLWKKKD